MDLPKGRANLLFGQLDHKKCIENEENRAEPREGGGWGGAGACPIFVYVDAPLH